MHLSLWKPITNCASMIVDKKIRKKEGSGLPSIRRKVKDDKHKEAFEEEASDDGDLPKPREIESEPSNQNTNSGKSKALAGLQAQKEFLRATATAAVQQSFSGEESLPDLHQSFSKFLTMYPKFKSLEKIDQLRSLEYSHLSDSSSRTCLDYCGFGLFSYFQTINNHDSSAFSLSEITANLSNYALHSGAEEGTAEHDIKAKIMDYLNIPESEYGLVFTVSRGSAFKLLAESYPFQKNKKLLTMFDHESQSVNWMAQCAKEKGAKVYNAWFKWPNLKPCSMELRKRISNGRRRRKGSWAGLFVFPGQSRVTGSRYSFQWMALAQQNNWHVLLDAGSLGPKDMDSLGLSLFRPDFIITSFYRVFGHDPSGFGCLLIKKSVMGTLQNQSGQTGAGMVRIVPVFPHYFGDSEDDPEGLTGIKEELISVNKETKPEKTRDSNLAAFSGVFTSPQVRGVSEAETDQDNGLDRDGTSNVFEEAESFSFGDVIKSPVFSEDETSENLYWIDLGQSPFGSSNSDQLSKHMPSSPLPHSWFLGKSKHNLLEPTMSFDAAVFSVSQEPHRVNRIPEEEKVREPKLVFENGCTELGHHGEIQEESKSGEIRTKNQDSEFSPSRSGSASTSEINHERKESAIRRETEGEFRLLGGREKTRYKGGTFFGLGESGRAASTGCVSFSSEENRKDSSSHFFEAHDHYSSDEVYDDEQEEDRKEPELICLYLDHVNMLGLNKTSLRLRCLVNWLVASLLQLHFPSSDGAEKPLVQIYGPKLKYERGASVSFNVRETTGGLVHPEVVQRLAEENGISLGIGILSHIRVGESQKQDDGATALEEPTFCNCKEEGKSVFFRLPVVTASLSFLTNFEDVYRLWTFVAKFLNPSYVDKGRLSTVPEDLGT
ncbi:Molybdenum cofactor sulfurtransferase [Bertholletia excelsa]